MVFIAFTFQSTLCGMNVIKSAGKFIATMWPRKNSFSSGAEVACRVSGFFTVRYCAEMELTKKRWKEITPTSAFRIFFANLGFPTSQAQILALSCLRLLDAANMPSIPITNRLNDSGSGAETVRSRKLA